MTVRNFQGTSAVQVVRTEMGVKITLGTQSVLSTKNEQVSGWFELEAAERILADLQSVIAAARAAM